MTTAIGTHPLITFAVGSEAVTVRDEVDGRHVSIRTPGTDDLAAQPALTELFMFPVDNAISVTASKLHVDTTSGASVWNERGDYLGDITTTVREFSQETHFVQVVSPLTAYVRIPETPFTVVQRKAERNDYSLELSFDEPTQVTIGGRSMHTRPETTITVPDDPEAMLEATAYLGSSIKEFSCERSWPSLRGHPPAIDRGSSLEIPSQLVKPETGVTISVPPTYAAVYRVAPLVFYLGADVEPGDRPELRLENGYVEPLRTDGRSLEETVDDLLGRTLLLDSLTRTDGYFSENRHEYDELGQHLPFYPPNLYDASLSEQLLEYLEVPSTLLEPSVPRWPLTAVLRTQAEDVELLPYLLDSLARIRVDESASPSCDHGANTGSAAADADSDRPLSSHTPSRSRCRPRSRPRSRCESKSQPLSHPSSFGYTTQEAPVGASTLLPEAFENGLTHSPTETMDATITYVTHSPERADRLRTHLESGSRSIFHRVGATIVDAASIDDILAALASDTDLCYVDVPLTDGAFECRDGSLPASAVDDVGASLVVVTGSEHREAGVKLIRQGALASAVLEESISPRRAFTAVEFLLRGISLVEGFRLAAVDESAAYRFVGDPTVTPIRRTGGGVTGMIDVVPVSETEHELSIRCHLADVFALGSTSRTEDGPIRNESQLNGATARLSTRFSTEEVISFLEDDSYVVGVSGRWYHGIDDPEAFLRDGISRTLSDAQ